MRHWKKKPWVDSEVRNWDYIADHLAPDATSADAGKVLTVGETGKPEWGAGGGSGGGVTLYGPYSAFFETTDPILASDADSLYISSINDPNTGDAYEADETIPYIAFIQAINITSRGVALVSYDNPVYGWYGVGVKVINVSGSTINDASAEMIFYTDHPLTKIEE